MRWLCLTQRLLLSLHRGKICRITVILPRALLVSSKISASLISCRDVSAREHLENKGRFWLSPQKVSDLTLKT